MRTAPIVALVALTFLGAFAACGNGVNSTEDAKQAYLGLDASIDKAITLGFAGFNAASSANISPQMTTGMVSGTLTVTGQVDQGASANKGMRLFTSYVNYNDDNKTTYDTDMSALPALDMMLKNIPTGTLSGTMAGLVHMTGMEKGDLTLALTFTGELQAGTGTNVE